MKRFLPVILSILLFTLFAIPKVQLGLAVFEEKEWMWAKPIFVRLFIDFVFAGVVALVVWMQLKRSYWVAALSFCLSTLLVSVFWISPLKHAPEAFQGKHPQIFSYIEVEPVKGNSINNAKLGSNKERAFESANGESTEMGVSVLEEEQLIRGFNQMIRALYRNDRKFILAHSDPSIFEYLKDIQVAALEEGKEILLARGITDQMLILSLRHNVSGKISSMSVQELFEYTLKYLHLSIGTGSGIRIDYVDISEDGQSATAEMVIHSTIPDDSVRFTIEEGEWKMSLLPLVPARDDLLVQVAFSEGISMQALILQTLEDEFGEAPLPELWNSPE